MVTPSVLAAMVQTGLAVSLELPSAFDARGCGVVALATLVFGALARAPRASTETRQRARSSLGVVLCFAPALFFPSPTPLLLSAVTFLLHWLAGTASRGGVAAASREDLMADLGFPVTRVCSNATPAAPSLGAPLGIVGLALALVLTGVLLVFPGTAATAAPALFLLASLTAWEQALRGYAEVTPASGPREGASEPRTPAPTPTDSLSPWSNAR